MQEKRCILLGVIAAAHGIKGEVKIRTYTENPENLKAHGKLQSRDGARTFEVTVLRAQGDHVIARIGGCGTRNDAEALRGEELYVPRDRLPELPEGEYYIEDLIGLAVSLPDGTPYGHIHAIHDFGGGTIIEITTPEGGKEFVAFKDIRNINVRNGTTVLEPMDTKG